MGIWSSSSVMLELVQSTTQFEETHDARLMHASDMSLGVGGAKLTISRDHLIAIRGWWAVFGKGAQGCR